MKSCKADFNFPFDGSKHATFKEVDLSRPVKYYDVHNVIKEMDLHQTVVLLGEAGCGKTYTGCRYMAQKYAEGYRVLFTTQSHKCLKNIASEFFTAIDELGISKKPEKSKILASFAKIGGIGGNSYIDTIPKRTIIYADECGLLDRKSFSALITLIKRGYHVIFAGDIKQDSVENFYVSLVAASTNYLELLGGTNDKYYEESLIYNAFGHYYDAFLRSQLKDLPIESFPYAIRLDTSPQPLQIRFDEGYEEVCLDKLPYYLDRINLFISAELCNKYARKLQLKRKQHLEDKGLRTSDMPCIWANVENKDDGDEETFGPIFPMQSFRIQENSNDRKHSYYCGDILRFLELDDKRKCYMLESK